MIRVAVFGVSGRMGKAIANELLSTKDMQLTAAIVRTGNELTGTKFPGSEVVITNDLEQEVDVIIDFTLPEGVLEHLQYAKPMVIGTTGFTDAQLHEIKAAAKYAPILLSSNMSIGVNWCYKLLENTNNSLDNSWQVAVSDIHHQHKRDQPSGTAKEIARILSTRNVSINSERRGEVVGEHSVSFANEFEEIIITHKAKDRSIFAKGAVIAAEWICDRVPRMYTMQDLVADRAQSLVTSA